MKRAVMIAMLALSVAPLAGCIIAPGPGPGYHRVWVRGHYGPYGAWHPGHWG